MRYTGQYCQTLELAASRTDAGLREQNISTWGMDPDDSLHSSRRNYVHKPTIWARNSRGMERRRYEAAGVGAAVSSGSGRCTVMILVKIFSRHEYTLLFWL